jgi:DNA sulfur modification protein DndD
MSFRRLVSGRETAYEVVRAWFVDGDDVHEALSVSRNGAPDPTLSDNWDDFIENYIPYSIANLFFFDGEQITDLANPAQAQDTLRTAIHTLLGLDLVDRLHVDLGVLDRKKRVDQKSEPELEHLSAREAQLRSLEDAVALARQNLAQRTALADRQKKELSDLNDKYRHEGGDLYDRAAALSKEREALRGELETINEELQGVAADCTPLALVTSLLTPLREQAKIDDEARRASRILRDITQRDETIIRRTKEHEHFSDKAVHALARILSDERKTLAAAASKGTGLDLPEGLSEALESLLQDQLPAARKLATERRQQHQGVIERLARVDDLLSAVPEEAKIAGLREELQRAERCLTETEAQVNVETINVAALEKERDKKSQEVQSLVLANNEAIFANEEARRLVSHASKVRNTLARFKQEIVKRHAAHLSTLILESFEQLARKSGLISRITIDPVSFQMSLLGGDQKPLPIDSLSAGERQLLATSLLWGLAKASGRPLPTVIDTPLGRLDSSHREHLVGRYFPVVSHQVILLSTDEEIHKRYLEQLAPHIGRAYQLTFDASEQRTKLTEGYFWDHATAA